MTCGLAGLGKAQLRCARRRERARGTGYYERYGDLDEVAGATDAIACPWNGYFSPLQDLRFER